MNQIDARQLAATFKALADENRIKILAYLARQEISVGDLAVILDITEPTVSYHLSKLREAGLLNLRTQGNNRYYRVNTSELDRMKNQVGEIETIEVEIPPAEDKSWIEDLPLEEPDKNVLRHYTHHGKLKSIPRQTKKLLAVLRWLTNAFQVDATYTEQEVNQIIADFHDDFASLRRELVDLNYLQREKDGSRYWRAS